MTDVVLSESTISILSIFYYLLNLTSHPVLSTNPLGNIWRPPYCHYIEHHNTYVVIIIKTRHVHCDYLYVWSQGLQPEKFLTSTLGGSIKLQFRNFSDNNFPMVVLATWGTKTTIGKLYQKILSLISWWSLSCIQTRYKLYVRDDGRTVLELIKYSYFIIRSNIIALVYDCFNTYIS